MSDLAHISSEQLAYIAKNISIPVRPALLADFQQEMAKDDPCPKKLAVIIARDVAMSAMLLKSANSAFFKLRFKVESVNQAIATLGISQSSAILTGLIAQQAIQGTGLTLSRFWDVSTKRAGAMSFLVKHLKTVHANAPECTPDIAYTFGLFCDIGIPLLMQRFPDYLDTLALANQDTLGLFTQVEDQRHQTNHATIGALLARSWGMSSDMVLAIRLHHEYSVMLDPCAGAAIKTLIALGLMAERAIQLFEGRNTHSEWTKGHAAAKELLGLSDFDLEDAFDSIHVLFTTEH